MAKKKKRKPESLTEFLRAKGGVKDEGGNLASREPDKQLKPFQRKLIQPKKGLPLDEAREAAVEAGYLAPGSDINDLLTRIDDELRGASVFSIEDYQEITEAAEMEYAREAAERPEPEEEREFEDLRGKRRKSEPLEYQLAYVIDKKKHGNYALAKARARRHFLQTGESIDGVHIIAKWRNPRNRNPIHANWKTTEDPGQSLQDFWTTLHGARGALRKLGSVDDFREEIEQLEDISKQKSEAMKHYHAKVRKLREPHPRWSYARAQEEYRRKVKKEFLPLSLVGLRRV